MSRKTANMLSLKAARSIDISAGDVVRYRGEEASVIERTNGRCIRIQLKSGPTYVNVNDVNRVN